MIPDTVRIIHCADFHICDDETLRTLEKITDICRRESVDFLLIAGDLFDRINVPRKIQDAVIAMLAEIPDTFVAISPGNHDPFSADSVYNLKVWPSNTHIFKGGLSCSDHENKGLILWGCGFTSNYAKDLCNSDIVQNTINKDLINICLVHGDLETNVSDSLYNPVSGRFISETGFDYIALGHVHKRSEIMRAGKTFYAYSGCPAARGFDETGDLGIYIGEISKEHCSLEFRPVGSVRYFTEEVIMQDFRSNLEAANHILGSIRAKFPETYKNDRYKIIMRGRLSLDSYPDIRSITEHLSKTLNEPRLEDKTVKLPDYESIAGEDSLKGIFAAKILERLSVAGPQEMKDEVLAAMEYGFAAFEGEVKVDEDQIDIDR